MDQPTHPAERTDELMNNAFRLNMANGDSGYKCNNHPICSNAVRSAGIACTKCIVSIFLSSCAALI